MHKILAASFTTALTSVLAAQNYAVVPAANAATDAMSYEWIAGATKLQRQQSLVGASHLTALVGRQIQALELRRSAVTEAFAAGSTHMAVSLSTSPNLPLSCSNNFAANVGPDLTAVFSGTVTLPASPATGGTGSPVAWTTNNTVRIAFTTPFLYQGGTLCIDITGTPIVGQGTWWMADAIEEGIAGTSSIEIGTGCGAYGGPQRQWSSVAARSLVAGGVGIFRAEGPPYGVTAALFGTATATPFPLSLLGIATPNCICHLDPLQPVFAMPVLYEPEVHPLAGPVSIAEIALQLPAVPQVLGFQMTTQWFDLNQLALSNAFTWQVGTALPGLDMALVEGHPSLPIGNVTTYLAHVFRFEYQ